MNKTANQKKNSIMHWSAVATFFSVAIFVVVLLAAPRLISLASENHDHIHHLQKDVDDIGRSVVVDQLASRYRDRFLESFPETSESSEYHLEFLVQLSLLKLWRGSESCTNKELFSMARNTTSGKVLIKAMSSLDERDEGGYFNFEAYQKTFSEVFPTYELKFDEFASVDYFVVTPLSTV